MAGLATLPGDESQQTMHESTNLLALNLMETLPLQHDRFYHIYNCGINGCALFTERSDYERFLHLYDKYIVPVAETYAWVLMGNHFHVLVRVKTAAEIGRYVVLNSARSDDSGRFQTTQDLSGSIDLKESNNTVFKTPNPTKHFAHLFNAYAKYFNTKHSRHGSLFEKPFKRKLIDNERYFKQVVMYIHNNPVHHGFCQKAIEYLWSSYVTCTSAKHTKLRRDEVIRWFGDVGNFVAVHNSCADHEEMEVWLLTS